MDINIPMNVTSSVDRASLEAMNGLSSVSTAAQTPYGFQQSKWQYQHSRNSQGFPAGSVQNPSAVQQNTYSQPSSYSSQQNTYSQSSNYSSQQNTYSQPGSYSSQQNTYSQPNNYSAQPQQSQTAQPVYSSQSNISSYSSPQPAPQPKPAPAAAAKVDIPAPPAESKQLRSGEKWQVPGTSLRLIMYWDVADGRCDPDASAFMLGANGKVPGDEWFVFYGQEKSPDASVAYTKGESGALMTVDLAKVDPSVQKIALAVTIYEAKERGLHFGMVHRLCMRLINSATNKEEARIDITEPAQGMTSLVMGELYRHNGAWKLNAMGAGVARDLAEFCSMYGVNLI